MPDQSIHQGDPMQAGVRKAERAEIRIETLIEIATLYYYDDVTQEELSRRFSLSRAKVGRLLKRARTDGLVEIRVHQPPAVGAELEQEFTRRFGIDRLLVSIDHRDPVAQRNAVAALVASHLERTLTGGSIVAVGMGRNVAAVADTHGGKARGSTIFICAIGGSQRAGEHMNPDHICRRLAARFGGESETLYAPALVTNAELRAELYRNETVKLTLDRARRANVALIGVGDLSEESNMVRMGWFSPEEIAEARVAGTIGDTMGYDFIDIHGQPANTGMQGRVIGLSRQDLERIPDVIAIASENTKAPAILGALRTGAIDTLATSFTNAHTILRLDDATRSPPAP
ncbi:sugar-binding transcriptional regulator [Lichenicoccus roseus]|nr:sugar-binding transcriptional regulator [Lichenicoccus roseus]